jgi:hypothetical protein
MKVASFNINNIRKRLPNLLEGFREAKPDIVCLQVSSPPSSLPSQLTVASRAVPPRAAFISLLGGSTISAAVFFRHTNAVLQLAGVVRVHEQPSILPRDPPE